MNKRYITFLFALPISIHCFAQGSWAERASLPADGRWGSFEFVIGGTGYIVGGRTTDGTDLAETFAYDPSADAWTQLTSLPGVYRRMATAFTIEDKGYVTCGLYNSGSMLNDLWEYDPITDTWTTKANLPAQGRYGAAGFSIDGIGYIVCGNMGSANGPYTADLWAYDPGMDNWQQRASIPGMVRYGAEAFVSEGMAYVLGGRHEDATFTSDVWRYDPGSDNWSEVAAVPTVGRAYPHTWGENNRGIICGGVGADGLAMTDCWMYHPQQDDWTPLIGYPGAGSWAGVSFSIQDRLFAGLGLSTGFVGNSDHWELTDLFTGIDEAGIPTPTQLFPNPCKAGGQLMIQTPFADGITEFTIFNGTGQVVHRGSLSSSSSHITLTIPELPPGIYTAAIRVNGSMSHFSKLMVN